jgi:hypothetical protein
MTLMRYFEIAEPSAGYMPADTDASDTDASDTANKPIWQLKRMVSNGAEDQQSRLRIRDQRQRMKSEAKPKD